jgi:hypothetical protein
VRGKKNVGEWLFFCVGQPLFSNVYRILHPLCQWLCLVEDDREDGVQIPLDAS